MTCNRVGCEKEAEFYPALLIRPKNYTGRPTRITLKMPLCEEHAKAKTAEEFITESLWNMVKGGVAKIGRKQPHRSSTTIEFLHMMSPVWKNESLFIFETAKAAN